MLEMASNTDGKKPQGGRHKASPTRATLPLKDREYPNRIQELTRKRGLSYQKIADALGTAYSTIANLAVGKSELTLDWMNRLAPVLGVSPADIIQEQNSITGLRRVPVDSLVHAGQWGRDQKLPDSLRYDVLIPDTEELRGIELYGLAVRGPGMNLRYPEGSTVICSPIAPTQYPDLIAGKRFHVRITRPTGECEDSIRRLEQQDGTFWLRGESSHAAHQEWVPLAGRDGMTVQILGRVHGAYILE
jgi:transcriptional regulator with XRE-family HTH domain